MCGVFFFSVRNFKSNFVIKRNLYPTTGGEITQCEVFLFHEFGRKWQVPAVSNISLLPPNSGLMAFLHWRVISCMPLPVEGQNRFKELKEFRNWRGKVVGDMGMVQVLIVMNSHFYLAELLQ